MVSDLKTDLDLTWIDHLMSISHFQQNAIVMVIFNLLEVDQMPPKGHCSCAITMSGDQFVMMGGT